MIRGVLINERDSVITLLDSGKTGDEITAIGEGKNFKIQLRDDVNAGHKVAFKDIKKGDKVIKYGFPIGCTIRNINAGEWVHSHNMASHYADQNSDFDSKT